MLRTLPAVLLIVSAGPALAQASAAPADPKPADPNRIVCERYEEIGSRLGSRKICKTAREWEEQKSSKREQRNTGAPGSN